METNRPIASIAGVLIALATSVAMVACSPKAQDPSAKLDVVRSKNDAVAIAKSAWAGLDLHDRALRVGTDEGKWVVQREWREGDPTEEAVIIDARTGRSERSSTDVAVLYLNRL